MLRMFEVVEWLDARGRSPFRRWFDGLPPVAAAKIQVAVERMRVGNLGDFKPVGEGVHERRIDWGAGLRIYFARCGSNLVILLGGGDKRRQAADIEAAKARWRRNANQADR